MLSASKQAPSNSGPVIGGLVVILLAAIAIALPPSPIQVEAGRGGMGFLESASLFSDGIAKQNASNHFGYMALDLTNVSTKSDALWRQNLELLSSRRVSIWGWVDAARCDTEFVQMLNDLPFAGLYVYGEGAADHAAKIRTMRASRPVIVVIGDRGDLKNDAVMLDLETYLASTAGQYAHPVLIADQLSATEVETAVEHANKLAGKDGTPTLLVARVPLG